MAANADALRNGTLDAVQLFQPYAEQLIRDGTGHVWYAAADRGPTAYTTLVARWPVLEGRRAELMGMSRAIAKTLQWIAATPSDRITPHLREHFPDLSPTLLAACIDRYKTLKLWDDDPALLRTGFDWLRSAMLDSGTIRHGASYAECVDQGLI